MEYYHLCFKRGGPTQIHIHSFTDVSTFIKYLPKNKQETGNPFCLSGLF